MRTHKLPGKWRWFSCKEIGVAADYACLQFKYSERGWTSVATCHIATIPLLKRDGVKTHIELLKFSSSAI